MSFNGNVYGFNGERSGPMIYGWGGYGKPLPKWLTDAGCTFAINVDRQVKALANPNSFFQNTLLNVPEFKKQDYYETVKSSNSNSNSLYSLNGNGELNIFSVNEDNVIINTFKKDVDDFIKWEKTFFNDTLPVSAVRLESLKLEEMVFNGTFTTGSNFYTTTVGDSFEGSLKGSSIWFNYYANNAGGVWEFTIDGDVDNKVEVSTFSATGEYKTANIKTNLNPFEIHTILGVFIGADQINPPVGGIARGWIRYVDSATGETRTLSSNTSDYGTALEVLSTGSNREFAFQLNLSGVENFAPYHTIETIFKISEPIYEIDGVQNTLGDLIKFKANEFDVIKILQNFYIRVGGVSGTNVATMEMTTVIKSDGSVGVVGKVLWIEPVLIKNGYAPMLPLNYANFDSLFTDYPTSIKRDDIVSRHTFEAESDQCQSLCGLNSLNKDLIATFKINNVYNTNRLYRPQNESFTLFALPTAPFNLKVYNEPYVNKTVTVGEIYEFDIAFNFGKIANVYDLVKENHDKNVKLLNFAKTTSDGYVKTMLPNGKEPWFLKFDGTNSLISNFENEYFEILGLNDFALSGVFLTPTTLNTGMIIAKSSDAAQANAQYALLILSTGQTAFYSEGAGTTVANLLPNTLYEWIIYRKSRVLKAKFNKIETLSEPNTSNLTSKPNLRIGARSSNVGGTTHTNYTNISLGNLAIFYNGSNGLDIAKVEKAVAKFNSNYI